ncbi:MAG: sugar-transfer associated ATP-grasp domain-containing protein [Candidatus Cloacimonetes bacterium]|jgi:hypothetical protein|nr:sugar-transfer associated ATP-grasp domain-containing protein [Candidatus Cloacimonadota bacterium]MDD4277522.1 sugar-transfer associated ATP-grasp domain-containing protein [Candidatus Cloacimonadota bacterium]
MKNKQSYLKQTYWFVKDFSLGALKNKSKHSILAVIYAYLKGFWADSLMVYNLRDFSLNQYLSDYVRKVKMPSINSRYSYILDDKLVLEKILLDVVRSFAIITSGVIIECNSSDILTIHELLTDYGEGEIILKPRSGGGGFGIYKITLNSGKWLINDKETDKQNVVALVGGLTDYLAYPCIKQQGYAHQVYPHSLNTIRILSVIDPVSGKPKIIRCLHRFGTSQSGLVDNWSLGGICCDIDIDTGLLSEGVAFPKDKKLKWHSVHPDTGINIEGAIVPNWDNILKFVLDAHQKISYLPYVGWDVISSGEEISLLEANSNSDVNLFQVHAPLLLNRDYVRFLEYNGVLRGR